MTTKRDVIRVHHEHPEWGSSEIARELGCCSGYVRATARRYAIALPVRWRPKKDSIQHLGRTARELGLSVDDLRRMAAEAAA